MTQPSTKPKRSKADEAERSTVFWLGFAVILACCIPQLCGYVAVPAHSLFIGTQYNIDDYCVYLSWIKQTAAGHFFVRNLFTTDPQPTLPFYILFSLIGLVVRITHLSAQTAILITRLGGGASLLALIYRFYRVCLPFDRDSRVAAFAFTCLSSGFGWIVWSAWREKNLHGAPVDAWQPEAYTFLSIYLEALFVVATLLIVGTMFAMLLCARTGKSRYALISGICVLLLGNFHSYDIVHICAAWGLFLVVWTVLNALKPAARVGLGRLWLQSILALALGMPTTLYNLYVYRTNPVFSARAQSPAPTPPIWEYVLGYGVVFILAVVALVLMGVRRRSLANLPPLADTPATPATTDTDPASAPGLGWADRAGLLLAVCWAIAPLIVINLPGQMQWRKMIMGEHIPLCLLAGWGGAQLFGRLRAPARRIALAALVLLSLPTNVLFVVRDIHHLEVDRSETNQWPYVSPDELSSFDWIEANTPQATAFVGQPFYCLYIAALTGRTVWAGHWSETPDDPAKIAEFSHFADSASPDDDRRAFLASTRAAYLYYPNELAHDTWTDKHGVAHSFADFAAHPPPYLVPVYGNKEVSIFHIDLTR